MKAIKFISVMCLSLMVSTSFAQIKVVNSGNVGVGSAASAPLSTLSIGSNGEATKAASITGSSISLWVSRVGTPTTSWAHSLYVLNNVYSGKINVGTYSASYSPTELNSGRSIGVLGVSGNSTSGYNYGVFGTLTGTQYGAGVVGATSGVDVEIDGIYAGFFEGDVVVNGTVIANYCTGSDKRLKDNIIKLDQTKALAGIMALNPVEYNYKQKYRKSSIDTSGIGKPYYDEKSQVFTKKHYGLLAQEIQAIYPNLVYEDQKGFLAVDYTGIIPLLIQSVKELSAKVDALSGGGVKLKSAVAEDFSGINLPCQLYQNAPNPFSTSTVIKYTLSNDITSASMLIFDMQGKLLKTEPLKGTGEGSITINGSSLTPGMYIYALVANGKEVDTKRMILTK